MRFEFDAAKSKANLAKHGMNFEMAQDLWRDVESRNGWRKSSNRRNRRPPYDSTPVL
jgi:uncharacterized DUF497 family protein